MKKLNCFLFLFLLFNLTGCASSQTDISTTQTKTQTDITSLEWNKISEKVDERYVNDTYPMNISVNYNLDTKNSIFNLLLIVKSEITNEDAVKYLTTIAKGINDLVTEQDASYEKSSEKSYGGMYKDLALHVQMIPETPYESKDNYIVDMTIPANEYIDITVK